MASGDDGLIEAAGGLVERDGPEVLVVHRPRYDDWSLPKGKLDRGESFEDAARREITEETGLTCRLAEELAPARYETSKGPKLVRYWRMTVESGDVADREPDDEVDECVWLGPDEALARLTYDYDRALVRTWATGSD